MRRSSSPVIAGHHAPVIVPFRIGKGNVLSRSYSYRTHEIESVKRPALPSRFGHRKFDEENVRIFRFIFVIIKLCIHFIPRILKRPILLDRRALPIRRSSSVHEGAYSIRTHTRQRATKRPALSSRFGHRKIEEENIRIFRFIFVIIKLCIHFIPRILKRPILLDRRALPIRRSSSVHGVAYSIRTHTRQIKGNKATGSFIAIWSSEN